MDSLEKCPKCLFQLDGFAFIGVHWRLIKKRMADFRKSLLFRDEKEKWQDLTANERESTRMDSLENPTKALSSLMDSRSLAFIGG